MANLQVKDSTSSTKYLKSSGAGTDGDPHIPEHLESNSAAIKTAIQAAQAAVEGVLSVDDNGASLTVDDGGSSITVDGTIAVSSMPALSAGESHVGEIGGNLTRVSAELTRPADTTAYAANDVVADSTSAPTLLSLTNAMRVSGGSGYVVRVALTTDKKSITPRFRIHFFNASNPTIANDNAQHKELYADTGKRLGYVDLSAMTTAADSSGSDTSRAFDSTVRLPIVASGSRTIYALLETLDSFTPASGEKFTLTVFVDNN